MTNEIADKINVANNAFVTGTLEKDFEFSHDVKGIKFYRSKIKVKRRSGVEDFIPILVSEEIMDFNLKAGEKIQIQGQLRSFREIGDDGKRHLILSLYALSITVYCPNVSETFDTNILYLQGKISNVPIFRETYFGKKITELMILVDRIYNWSDYIPCIAWGRDAYYSSELQVGDRIEICSRIQSKKYFKRDSLNAAEGEYKEAYEVCITNIKKVE